QRRERRIEHCLPIARLTRVKILEALRDGQLKRVVIGEKTLNDHLTRAIAATGAARNLCEQLERSLGGAEIGERQCGVGSETSHKSHEREVVPLRDHLGAAKNA